MAVRLDRARARRRARHLASDKRAGSWAAGEARRLHYRFLRRTWRRIAALAAAALAVTPLVLFLPGWSRAFVAGVWLSSVAWVVVTWTTLASGAGLRLMGEAGEQWTAQELRQLRSRGWRIANHVLIVGPADIDHVAVGPGGLILVETKWTSWTVDLAEGRGSYASAVRALNERARRLRLVLKPQLGDVPVHTAVVLWGPDVVDDADATRREPEGTVLLGGSSLRAWLAEIPDAGLQPAAVDAAWHVIDAATRRGDRREQAQSRHPRPVTDSLVDIGIGVAAGFGGVIALGSLAHVVHNGVGQALASFGVIGIGFIGRKFNALRLPALGWIAGTAGAALFALGYTAAVALT